MSNDNLGGVWTKAGLDKLAAQLAGGEAVTIKSIALGDGGGSVPPASESVTALLGERWRGSVNSVEVDPESSNSVIVEAVIPYNVGGWFIREWGLFDAGGELVAYGPHAEFYKPVLDSGTGAELLERIKLPVTSQSQINLTISSDVLATHGYVDRAFAKVAEVVEDIRAPLSARWQLTQAVASGGALALPEGVSYLPGHKALMLFFDGVACAEGLCFEETGEKNVASTSVKLLFNAPQGSEMEIRVLGHSAEEPLI